MATALRILRGAALALRAGEPTVRHPDGREFDAADLPAREVPFNLLAFAAALLPGWMSRGRTWPTALCADAGVDDGGFGPATALTGLLREEFPGLGRPPEEGTIVANYMVGGMVAAPEVAGARAALARHRAELDCDATDLRKLDEARGSPRPSAPRSARRPTSTAPWRETSTEPPRGRASAGEALQHHEQDLPAVAVLTGVQDGPRAARGDAVVPVRPERRR
ncbi:hypothetical protein ACFHW2_28035 [Actinomadura sp. LOL_016]|uniref:hypothetical protein n=1 Tax=unclassified Actinomadura TaxID=2626254 RepID=UPI003A7F77F7